MLLMKNLSTQLWETEEQNRTRKSIDKKTFQLGLRTEKEKPRFVMREGTLVKERLD